MNIAELNYSKTNTYLIEGNKGCLLFDTGWAGTYEAFCRELNKTGKKISDISFILISHYHPDHMGIAQQIACEGPVIAVMDVQKDFIHFSDHIFEKENRKDYRPVDESAVRMVKTGDESREFLKEMGIDGTVLHTPGHSDDSVSLLLDSGELFTGDLNPLYELELFAGTEVEKSWNMLLSYDPSVVYYGHARTFVRKGRAGIDTCNAAKDAAAGNIIAGAYAGSTVTGIGTGNAVTDIAAGNTTAGSSTSGSDASSDLKYAALVEKMMKLIDKGCDVRKIRKKTGADEAFVQDVMRMYLTHPGVSVQGILDRIEIKGR